MKIGNLTEVKAWADGAFLTPGTHPARIIEAEEGLSKEGNPQFELKWEAVAGEEKGGTIREWVVVVPATLGKVRSLMEACGVDIPPGEFELNASDLIGHGCSIVVRKQDPSDKYPKVVGYSQTSDIPADTTGLGASKGAEVDVPFRRHEYGELFRERERRSSRNDRTPSLV